MGHHQVLVIIAWISLSQRFGHSSDLSLMESDISMESSQVDNNWRLKLLDFPRPGRVTLIMSTLCDRAVSVALYDTGLSNSLQVSVHVSQIKNASNATFTFMVMSRYVWCCILHFTIHNVATCNDSLLKTKLPPGADHTYLDHSST